MTGDEKTRYRNRVEWKRFRDYMITEYGSQCCHCGMKYTKMRQHILNVHHLDPDNYDDLNPDKFRVLCVQCHEHVEHIALRILGKGFRLYDNFTVVFLGLRDVLPYAAQEKGDAIIACRASINTIVYIDGKKIKAEKETEK